ncbi:hypothetical protein A1QO_00835 [Vibrio genomosp. F10 str. ZF-129]|uniref:Uncharacterized protein n=1 Tax=Vibrio genomosp. F10 str. ZF-129 TaxID=1187848 RepID=A0A1E5BGF3_9VIBR|nr:hypothetical protein [Vibrio genomosp. F10]OEE35338.1 hypothetical protein A1QO_00835 [Vibrio genomosp. F10 str. ZF-129]
MTTTTSGQERLTRKTALEYTTFLDKVALDVAVCKAVHPQSAEKIIENLGLQGKEELLDQSNCTSLGKCISLQNQRLQEMIVVNVDLISDRLKALQFGTLYEYQTPDSESLSNIPIDVLVYFVRCANNGSRSFLCNIGLSRHDIDIIKDLSLPEVVVIAHTIDLQKEPLITFTPKFIDRILKVSYEVSSEEKLHELVVLQGITQELANKYLRMGKTKLSEIRTHLKVKERRSETEKNTKVNRKLGSVAASEVINMYERDYGLYSITQDAERIYALAIYFNVTFTCIAKVIEHQEDFYDYLMKMQTSFSFAKSFYKVPERLRKQFSTAPPPQKSESCNSITIQKVLSHNVADPRLRLLEIYRDTNLPLNEIYSIAANQCCSERETDSLRSVFLSVANSKQG